MSADARLAGLVKCALWGGGGVRADAATFEAMERHAILALAAPALPAIDMPDALRARWKAAIMHEAVHNERCLRVQAALPIDVPYVILKGTSAARYYPHPEYRAMGDIDIMTRREDFEAACAALSAAGFPETTRAPLNGVLRHRSFRRDGVEIELHAWFAHLNDPEKARRLDDMIIEGINPSHVLPDMVNGLVILEHISQHLEEGLGLRQIIDWMMFAHRCLPDAAWPAFRALAAAVGLERLAVVTTRMCTLELGLSPRAWCEGADPETCEELMDYVLACGNFGALRDPDSQAGTRVFSAARSPRAVLTLLQRHGLYNWRSARRWPVLRPFAWLYQIGRYARRGALRRGAVGALMADAREAQRRDRLMDALGVSRLTRGYAVYREGRYEKD